MAGGVLDGDDFRRRIDDAVLVLFALVAESVGWATVALLDQDIERANQGGVAANAACQRSSSSASQAPLTSAPPATASHATRMRARAAMRRISDTHSASKPERQCATMLRCTATKRR